ncbi:MAG: hypothetical protein FH756_07695 [Firmicutes bacterium]|nr:hypothetical protein [Bacillota bacterium]
MAEPTPQLFKESGGLVMEPAFVVLLTACGVTTLSAILSKRLGKEKEMDKWSGEMKRCSDLSTDAEEAGRKDIYSAFQKKGNEAMHKYFAALYLEAVVELSPHVLVLGVLQRYYTQDVLHFGFSFWPFGSGIGFFGVYLVSALVFHFAVLKKLKKKLPIFGTAK